MITDEFAGHRNAAPMFVIHYSVWEGKRCGCVGRGMEHENARGRLSTSSRHCCAIEFQLRVAAVDSVLTQKSLWSRRSIVYSLADA